MSLMARFIFLLSTGLFVLLQAGNCQDASTEAPLKGFNHSVRSDWEENQFEKIINSLDAGSNSLLRSFSVPAPYELTSPYQAIPGSYEAQDRGYYLGDGEYSGSSIYGKYLASGAYLYHSKQCANHYGQVPKVSQQDVDSAFGYANHQMRVRYPEYANKTHYSFNAHKEVEGQMMELVSEYFAKFKYQLATYLPVISVEKQYQHLNREGDISCTPYYNQKYECSKHLISKFRTIDGSCNNPFHPYWGRSNICHIRLLPADYSDGIHSFRMAKNGKPLPNPRDISNIATPSKDYKSYYTALALGWGQFIAHDITNTANNKQNPDGHSKVDCCQKPDRKCAAIHIQDRNDYLSAKYKGRCINFMRSHACPLCKLGPRQQMNSQTSFLDGSQIYGAFDKEAILLRSFQNGMLKVGQDRFGQPILPPSDVAKPCTPLKKGLKCFFAGDNRVNQHPLLLTMHTLWVRNHNYHAIRLKQVNPKWPEEKLYQEARRLVIAELQHITYNEFLPVILGSVLTSYYSLNSLKSGYTRYEPQTDPSSWNEFTIAGRYGHSQIKDFYRTISASLNSSSLFLLKDNFFEPGFAYDGLLDDIIRGLTSEPANTVDPYYSLTAKNFVLRDKSKSSYGLDLVSVNVLRSRDHGLPGYTHFLKACFNYNAKTWKSLERFIPLETLTRLQSLYSNVDDLDVYVGAVAERHFIDASLGPTFGCLLGIQFYHSKFGDRYFYEHGNEAGSFSPAQLDNIRRVTSAARVFCRTSKGLGQIQPLAFYLPSGYNQLTDCTKYAEINYQLWKE